MVKRIFLALCLLVLCVTVSSGGITDKLKSVIARKNVADGCDDCSGAVILTWHAENSGDVTSGTPCGCADNDEAGATGGTWSYSGTASDGSYSMAVDTDGDTMSYDEVIGTTVTVCAKIRATWSEFSDSTELFALLNVPAEDWASIYVYGYDTNTVDVRFRYEGQNAGVETRTLSNIPVTDATWCSVCISYDTAVGAGSDTMWFWIDGNGDGVMDAGEYQETTDRTLTDMVDTSVTIKWGAANVNVDGNADFLIDDCYVDSTYRNAAFVW